MTKPQIGYIGLGTMGGPMANNLLKAGYPLVVHDFRQASAETLVANGAQWAETPADVAKLCKIIFTSLPGPPEVEAVALGDNGILSAVQQGAIYCDLSTNSRSTVQKINAAFEAKGAFMLDCPVSGGPSGATSGSMAIWAGGDKNAFDQCEPILSDFSDKPLYIGTSGQATVAKLVHNMTQYAVTIALGEVMTMGVKAGVDPLVIYQAVRQGAVGRRRTFDSLIPQILTGKYEPAAFALKLAYKDVKLATALAEEVGAPMPLCNVAVDAMTEAMERGWENWDARSCILPHTERAGVSLACDPDALRAVMAADDTETVVFAIP